MIAAFQRGARALPYLRAAERGVVPESALAFRGGRGKSGLPLLNLGPALRLFTGCGVLCERAQQAATLQGA